MSHSEKKYLYVNPLGGYEDTSFNNVQILRNSLKTADARVKDSKILNESHYLRLSVWSIAAGVSIIALLIMIKNIRS